MVNKHPPISDEEDRAINLGISKDKDTRELTEEDAAYMVPVKGNTIEALKEAARKADELIKNKKRGRPPATQTKTPVTIRLDNDIVIHFKNTGKGWQSRMNDALKQYVEKEVKEA